MWLILQVGWRGEERDCLTQAAQADLSASRVVRRSLAGLPICQELALCLRNQYEHHTIPHDIHRLLHAEHDDPFGVLGLHRIDQVWVVRSLRPDAKELAIVDRHNVERRFPAPRIAEEGLFEAQLEGVSEALEYLVELTTWSGETFQISDPYSYGPILGELDMHLYKVGNHYEIYEKLGAHLTEIKGLAGVSFAVWAPNAQRVSVVGDFNGWDGRTHQMRKRIEAGIWEIFIPGVGENDRYKYEVRNCFGNIVLKSDPFSFFGQHGVQTASPVFNLDRFKWSDDA
jgi:1,4-alpha-glucan branching enzyme